jgi:hypothetical protein
MGRASLRYRAFVCVALSGCAGGSGSDKGASGSGLPRTSAVVSLTPQQGAQLCDWTNREQGGYGRRVTCPSGPISTNVNQAQCVAGLPDLQLVCPALTVADVEDCTLAHGTDLCKYDAAPACAPLRACGAG